MLVIFIETWNDRTWVGQAKNLCSPEDSTEFCLDNIEEEINLLEQEVNQQEIGFCHNDLQYGNIMINEDTNAITIIVSLTHKTIKFLTSFLFFSEWKKKVLKTLLPNEVKQYHQWTQS